MKVLYAARMGRPDLLRATCMLASRVAKWDTECDKRLHRLMSYISGSKELKAYAYAADPPSKCHLALSCDADFAGDKSDAKSTTGVHLAIVGPNTYFPLSSISEKQGCVSQSTCEAEMLLCPQV